MTLSNEANIVELCVPGEPESLALVRMVVSHLAADAGFEKNDQNLIETAVYEVCENVLQHAYESMTPKPAIEIVVSSGATTFQIDVIDRGESFDYRYDQVPKFPDHWQIASDHGLGLFVVQQCMDEAQYDVLPDKTNRFRLIKRITFH
jgi:anti-sigma regulatory factor (Ser/Thr protein kinase)